MGACSFGSQQVLYKIPGMLYYLDDDWSGLCNFLCAQKGAEKTDLSTNHLFLFGVVKLLNCSADPLPGRHVCTH